MRSAEFKIYEVKHHKADKFQVNFGLHQGGKQRFNSKAEANAAIKAFKAQQKRLGELAGKLSATEIAQVLEAKRLMEGTGVNFLEAVQIGKVEVVKHLATETFGRALDEYLDQCKRKHEQKAKDSPLKEPKHVWAVGQTLKLFADLRAVLLTEVTADQIDERLDRSKHSQFNKHLAHLKAVFNYAKGKKWIQENPVLEIEKESVSTRDSKAYRAEDVRKFMEVLTSQDNNEEKGEYKSKDFVPYYALIFFAGIRPDTAYKLEWSALNSGSEIHLKRSISKTSKAFSVTITPTLQAWIDWWCAQGGKRDGPIHPMSDKTRTRWREKLCKAAGIEWVQDAPRRTFATAHYLTHKNAALTAAELGHINGANVFDQHYRDGTITPADAKAFWNILPPALEATSA